MTAIDIEEVRSWAVEAGAIAKRYFNNVSGRRKANNTLVSEADEAIEKLLEQRIVARYPGHGIIGEESTRRAGDGEFIWAVDPLDGTASFLAGLPLWSVSIGLLREGRPYAGVVYVPILGDSYWADGAGGAYLNGRPMHVASPHPWDDEDWLATPSTIHRRYSIDFPGKVRTAGSTAAGLAYVARGSAVGALLSRALIWDIAAGLALLEAAGGCLVGLSGAPIDTASMIGGRPLPEPAIAAEPSHAEALRRVITLRPRS